MLLLKPLEKSTGRCLLGDLGVIEVIWKVTEKGLDFLGEYSASMPRGGQARVLPDEELIEIAGVLDIVDNYVVEGDTVVEAYSYAKELMKKIPKKWREEIPDLKYWKKAYEKGFIEKTECRVL